MVFICRKRGARGGEYWIPLDCFLLKFPGWFEKRAVMDANIRRRAEEAVLVAARRAARDEAKKTEEGRVKRKCAPRRVFVTAEERTAGLREWERKRAAKPETKAYRREWSFRKDYDRVFENELRRADVKSEREFRRMVRDELAVAMREELAARPPRPPRKILTDEERREAARFRKRNYKHRRRARLAGLPSRAKPAEVRAAMKLAKGRCYYCRGKFSSLTIDHVVPIAAGGGHTLDNIVFACHACNSEKRDLPAADYAKRHGLLLA